MIQEDYVGFETAKLLYKKGFDCECIGYYVYYEPNNVKHSFPGMTNSTWGKDVYSAPTLQMAMKWLREVHKVDITIDPHKVGNNWIYQFHICQNQNYLFSKDIHTSYENCAESAIKYCLEKLI